MSDNDAAVSGVAMILMVMAVVAVVGIFAYFMSGNAPQQTIIKVPQPEQISLPTPAKPGVQ